MAVSNPIFPLTSEPERKSPPEVLPLSRMGHMQCLGCLAYVHLETSSFLPWATWPERMAICLEVGRLGSTQIFGPRVIKEWPRSVPRFPVVWPGTVLRCALVQCLGTYINITWGTLENPGHVASVSSPWESVEGPKGFLGAARDTLCESL